MSLTSRDFCYWLQGLFELGNPTQLDAQQTDLVKRHLAMVFKHEIDPSAGSAAHQKELSNIHGGFPPITAGAIEAALKEAAAKQPTAPPHETQFCPHTTLIRC